MSEYEDQYDDDGVVCPYCKKVHEIEPSGYSEEAEEMICSGCAMKFITYQTFSVSHHSNPDCEINNQTHSYGDIKESKGSLYRNCDVCGNIRIEKRDED